METVRLRRIQEPSRVERLLDAYVSRSQVLGADAHQIRDPSALPKTLRDVLTRARHQGQVWTCWEDRSRMWLFTCDMSLELSRERGAPVLQVNRYTEDGGLDESGRWIADPHGLWSRCTD